MYFYVYLDYVVGIRTEFSIEFLRTKTKLITGQPKRTLIIQWTNQDMKETLFLHVRSMNISKGGTIGISFTNSTQSKYSKNKGWQTSIEQIEIPRFMFEGPWLCLVSCFLLIHFAWNYITKTFLLVRQSVWTVWSKQLLCFVHGRGQKCEKLLGFITIPFYWLCSNLLMNCWTFFWVDCSM